MNSCERLDYVWLGTVPYQQALALQEHTAREVEQGAPPVLLMLEHPPTVTLGRMANEGNLRLAPQEYSLRGIDVVRVLRGGDVTYHGPGQLVGYPVVSLRHWSLSVPRWVEVVAQALLDYLLELGLACSWSEANPGVWCGEEKIAAVGFRIRRGVSTHGFALNLDVDLAGFGTIVPCGLAHRGVTSVIRQRGVSPSPGQAAAPVAAALAHRCGVALGDQLGAESVWQAFHRWQGEEGRDQWGPGGELEGG